MAAPSAPAETPTDAPKRVGFLELFFDLVFVFAITQLVGVLHDDHTAAGWGRAGLVLWLVWWAWSQYTWAGNAIDLERRDTRIWFLVATGTMLVAAAAMPDAFGDGSAWFAVAYASVRLLGLALYWFGLADDPEHRDALRTYLPLATASPVLVLAGGLVGGTAQIVLWCLGIAIDLSSVAAAGRGEFRVDPGHFAERHGLIVIIALGESVVVIGSAATEVGMSTATLALVVASFATVAGFWWCYFDRGHHVVEAALRDEPNTRRRGHLARDLFTLGHIPIVAGTVVFAAGIEEALLHPSDVFEAFTVTAVVAGITMFAVALVAIHTRARRSTTLDRDAPRRP